MRSARHWIVLALVALIAPAAVYVLYRHRDNAVALVEWIRSAGVPGAVAFGAIYVGAVVMVFPAAILSAAAGFIFGSKVGIAVAIPMAGAAATTAFLIGRALGRKRLAPLVALYPRLAAIDRVIAADGIRMVTLLRLATFLPHNLLNYGLSFTGVRARHFFLGTLVGGVPATVFQVYAGSLTRSASELLRGHPADLGRWTWVFTGAGVIAALGAIALIARAARREIERTIAASAKPANGPAASVPESDV